MGFPRDLEQNALGAVSRLLCVDSEAALVLGDLGELGGDAARLVWGQRSPLPFTTSPRL